MIDYIACGTGMLGVITTAMSEKWYGWAIGAAASLCWTIHGLHTHQWALVMSGAFFTISQIIGFFRRIKNKHHVHLHESKHRPIADKFKEWQK